MIKTDEQTDFIKTVYEDLTRISPAHIEGMGITGEQLEKWLAPGIKI